MAKPHTEVWNSASLHWKYFLIVKSGKTPVKNIPARGFCGFSNGKMFVFSKECKIGHSDLPDVGEYASALLSLK